MARVSVSSAILVSSLQMLHYLLEMGMSSIDLTLNNVGTFFETAEEFLGHEDGRIAACSCSSGQCND